MARKHAYSQHFLRSPQLVAELIGHSQLRKTDTVYDLGAGSGVIASVLARRVQHVAAVELEPDALRLLRTNVGGLENVTIIPDDILTVALPATPYSVFSNIPFSRSAAIVRRLTEAANPPERTYLITQKQFARKLVPGNDHFTSQLGAQLGPWFSARIRKPLRKTDFTPPPAVDTVLLELLTRSTPLLPPSDAPAYRNWIEQAFASQPFFARLPRERAGISSELRPSQLTLEQWVALWTACK